MHELALTQSVVDMILERTVDRQVSTVRLRVGLLSGVIPDAMRFCYDLVTAGTGLQGSTLEIEQPPGRAHCRTCGKDVELGDLILLCPCGSADVHLIGGQELEIISVELERDPCV